MKKRIVLAALLLVPMGIALAKSHEVQGGETLTTGDWFRDKETCALGATSATCTQGQPENGSRHNLKGRCASGECTQNQPVKEAGEITTGTLSSQPYEVKQGG